MAMAMRLPAISRAVTEVASAPVGLRRLFCSNASRFSFLSPQAESQTPARPQAEPSTNLFVSGNKPFSSLNSFRGFIVVRVYVCFYLMLFKDPSFLNSDLDYQVRLTSTKIVLYVFKNLISSIIHFWF